MSDVMLHGVLRMPPELWRDEPMHVSQRHSRYIQASDRIDADAREIARLRSLMVGAPPLEPTPEMIEAGAQRLVRWEDGCTWPDSWSGLDVAAARNDAERVWRSMWAAFFGGDE